MINIEDILIKIDQLPLKPVAVQALWDGDTTGWMLIIEAITNQPSSLHPKFTRHYIASLRGEGGDFRLFQGIVPPWPEAKLAEEVGKAVVERGIQFYFPSPVEPEDSCPNWWEKDDFEECKGCGMPLKQASYIPWYGICSICNKKREKA